MNKNKYLSRMVKAHCWLTMVNSLAVLTCVMFVIKFIVKAQHFQGI